MRLKLFSEEVKLTNTANNHFVKVNFKGFPYLGIWTKPVKAPFLCIEPWYGRCDSVGYSGELKDREWIQKLEPKETFDVEYKIIIE